MQQYKSINNKYKNANLYSNFNFFDFKRRMKFIQLKYKFVIKKIKHK